MRHAIIILSLFVLHCGPVAAQQPLPDEVPASPMPSLHVPCEIVEWYDADTPTVEIRIRMRIRLVDCWAPEVRGEQKVHGIPARDKARTLLPVGTRGVLSVSLDDVDRFDDVLSLGRVLGRIWTDDGDVSTQLREAGATFATREKLAEWLRDQPHADQ